MLKIIVQKPYKDIKVGEYSEKDLSNTMKLFLCKYGYAIIKSYDKKKVAKSTKKAEKPIELPKEDNVENIEAN